MSSTINDLYLKYVDGAKEIEEDRAFQYLFEMIDAGEKEFSQQHQVLHKVVDERWLETIEDCLDPLNRIIEKPRRFIERVEEVVPVALAKKITADSVMHLSMNTQFIAKADEESVEPTHILNVSLDESYDLYENRFIYHLIQRLVTFVDKRTDIIFWSTGDETQNTLELTSHVDDAYERIDYKVQMTVKNIQTLAENDADNMEVFKRIDRVRRLVMALRHSAFCEIMSGCQKVKSPIQRTNLLTKDPDYRKCYQLWQFLESYDEVGYTIDVQNSALEFDEEYVIQMYNNMIANYTVFKSITEPDPRDMDAMEPQRRRTIKPRFNKEIIEEIVTDYNIPEVEVKQVIVEEVTQAQLDAEAKLAEEIKAREDVEQALREAEAGAHHSMIQADYAMSAKNEAEDIAKEAEEKLKEVEEKLELERSAKEDLLLQLQEKDEIIASKDEQISTEVKEYVKQLEEQQKEFEYQIEDMSNRHELEIKEIFDDYKEKTEDVEMEYIDKMDKLEDQFAVDFEVLQTRNEEQMTQTIAKYEEQLAKQAADYDARIEDEKAKAQQSVDAQFAEFQATIKERCDNYEAQITESKNAYEQRIAETDAAYKEELESVKNNAAELVAHTEKKAEAAIAAQKETAETKYNEYVAKSEEELRALQVSSEKEITEAKAEAKMAILKEQEESARKIAENQAESDKRYSELKVGATEEYNKLKKTSADDLDAAVKAAQAKEAELNAVIARLEQEKASLEKSEKALKEQLANETKARATAETKMVASEAIIEALEKKSNAKTLHDFGQARRAELKARRTKDKK